ncbi:SanA/YdcF family protein [Photobacterium angustum]|uniref:SanA/YdcF family protein n=1 Tax=Photobacterium angustum TaxID=661 RepID=UPI0005E4FDAD|nr:ElyC/SanA/YdcF family protein [Photobacterium angustum]KJF94722.1 SanA protein [Photobacterium angustum]PSW81275.1 SanA protein [Photobacterium angustum]
MKLLNLIRISAVICILFVSTLLLFDRWVSARTSDRIYHDISAVPKHSVGLVLGTSKYIAKTLNPYYEYRITAALDLFKQGKIDYFLLSGDNAHRSYNEPWTMKRDLLKAGVPDDKIVLDYAGFRTLDSIVRAKEVFETDNFTIITQQFHCERALFIADSYKIKATCLAVHEPNGTAQLKIRIREVLARVKALSDLFILNVQPKFLGPKEPIIKPAPIISDDTVPSSAINNQKQLDHLTPTESNTSK